MKYILITIILVLSTIIVQAQIGPGFNKPFGKINSMSFRVGTEINNYVQMYRFSPPGASYMSCIISHSGGTPFCWRLD